MGVTWLLQLDTKFSFRVWWSCRTRSGPVRSGEAVTLFQGYCRTRSEQLVLGGSWDLVSRL